MNYESRTRYKLGLQTYFCIEPGNVFKRTLLGCLVEIGRCFPAFWSYLCVCLELLVRLFGATCASVWSFLCVCLELLVRLFGATCASVY
jgi:hypothetical protein